jgi:hypothetical protein
MRTKKAVAPMPATQTHADIFSFFLGLSCIRFAMYELVWTYRLVRGNSNCGIVTDVAASEENEEAHECGSRGHAGL